MRRLATLALLVAAAGCGGDPAPAPPAEDLDRPFRAGLDLPRAVHTASQLPDGSVLIAGGCVTDGCGRATDTTEIYHDGRFSPGPRLTTPRDGHTATRLPDGRVLLVGGYAGEGRAPLANAELCDAERCRPAGALARGRGGHAAAPLPGGGVLVIGGAGAGGTTETWRDGRFRPGPPLLHPRDGHTATALADGRILVTGGYGPDGRAVAEAEILDGGRWTPAGRLRTARGKHAAVRLTDGSVIVIGGSRDPETRERLASTEVHVGTAFVPGPRLRTPRYKIPAAAVLLPDGRVLVAGDGTPPEILDVDGGRSRFAEGASVGAFATATALAGGDVLLVGGYDDRIRISGAALVARDR
jgi:Galactose oxidase, central domain